MLCAILAFTVSELMAPSAYVQSHPRILSVVMSASVAVCISLMLTFIYELTWYSASKRMKVFKTEVAKVMMTAVYFNLFCLLFMSWMWQLSKQIKQMQKTKELTYREQRRLYEESVQRIRRHKPEAAIRPLELKITLTDSERHVRDFEAQGIANQCMTETMGYAVSKFFCFLDQNHHITDSAIKQQISSISNLSAVVFFLTVQIPLSRLSPGFAFATCFVIWFIDHKTKRWVYDISGCVSRLDLQEFRNLFAVDFDFTDESPVKSSNKEDLRAVVDWFCLNMIIMVSLYVNYVYRVSFGELVRAVAHWVI